VLIKALTRQSRRGAEELEEEEDNSPMVAVSGGVTS